MAEQLKNLKGTTETIAAWIESTQYEDIPAKGIAAMKNSILDWIGCALVAADRPAARIVIDHVREEAGAPQARVVGTDILTTSADAALANGVLGHIDDYDDSGHGGHPSAHLTPTALALGEELQLTGKQLLTAWAVGYDVTKVMGNLHADRAWHKTAIFGTIGCVAEASKLLRLDTDKTCMAFGIGASEAGGVMRNFGTMTKAFHAANAARNGIVAAKLARRGFTAAPDIIEARYGFADCFGGEKCYLPALTQFLGEMSLISAAPPAVKKWPCCSSNHRPITAVLEFLQSHPVKAEDIARVEHYGFVQPGTGSLLKSTDIKDGLEGKFSMEYNIAAAFLDRKVDLATFSDERVRRADIQSFIKRVHRFLAAEVPLHSSRTKGALSGSHIRVFMKDGTVHEVPVGLRTVLKGDAILDKFRANAAGLKSDRIDRVISMCMELEKLSNVRSLLDEVTIGSPSRKAAVA